VEDFAEVLSVINSKVANRKKKHLQHLAVDFSFCKRITSIEFRIMISELAKSFKSLKYLHFNFEKSSNHNNCKFLNDDDLIWFSSHITKNMTNLMHFSLHFHQNNLITQEGLKVFCRQIGNRLKRLECLTLDFSRCERIGEKCVKALTHYSSGYLRHLRDLRIVTSNISLYGVDKIHFNKSRYLKNLESFDLYLDQRNDGLYSRSIKEMNLSQQKFVKNSPRHLSLCLIPLRQGYNDGLKFLSSRVIKYLQNLKILNLDLECVNMTTLAAQMFIQTLNQKVHNLEHLKLHLNTCQRFTDEFLNLFQLPEENRLTKLEMQFEAKGALSERNHIPMKRLPKFITNSLQYLTNLTYLDLRFDLVLINDKEVKALTSCIAQHLTKLEFLNISFFWSSFISRHTLAAFKEDFCAENALLNLKSLIISFSSCDNFTKEGVNSLRTALKTSKSHIEKINVYFVDYKTDSNWGSDDEEDSYEDSSYHADDYSEMSDNSDENEDDYEDISDSADEN